MSRSAFSVLSIVAVLTIGCDEAAPENVEDQAGHTPLGKADSIDQGPSVIDFDADFTPPQAAPALAAGGAVQVSFDTQRFYEIYDAQSQVGWFASTFHCYGYGCCEVSFPDVSAHHRFDGGEVVTQDISSGEASIDVPEDADELEMWFSTPGFELRTWYCGCDAACAQQNYAAASPQWHALTAWDSAYGNNYAFPITDAGAYPIVHGETVKLIDASLSETGTFAGVVEVANLAYDKDVEVWYATADGSWTSVEASFLGMAEGDAFERWSFSAPDDLEATQFAIRYETAGAVHWDNNCGWDYQLLEVGASVSGQAC